MINYRITISKVYSMNTLVINEKKLFLVSLYVLYLIHNHILHLYSKPYLPRATALELYFDFDIPTIEEWK